MANYGHEENRSVWDRGLIVLAIVCAILAALGFLVLSEKAYGAELDEVSTTVEEPSWFLLWSLVAVILVGMSLLIYGLARLNEWRAKRCQRKKPHDLILDLIFLDVADY